MKQPLISLLLFYSCISFMSSAIAQTETSKQPNILMILVDDLGWRDLSSYGSDFYQTPNIDQLANSGIKFSQAYSAAHICSPTRMSILTGQHPARLHVTDWIPGWQYPNEKYSVPAWNLDGIKAKDLTVGEVLQDNGYKTAWFGKWHIKGLKEFVDRPLTKQDSEKNIAAQYHGFDAGHQDFSLNGVHNKQDPKGVHQLTNEAIDYISQISNQNKPWFVTISHYSVHTKVHFNDDIKALYDERKKWVKSNQNNSQYAAMLHSLDDSVATVMNYLNGNNLAEDTLVILLSDNGGLDKNDTGRPTDNAPLRNGKATLYEGGIRIPFIASWPGQIKPNQTSDTLISTVDLLPTFAQISGAKTPTSTLDGVDISHLFFEPSATLHRNALYWHYPHYHRQGQPSGAIRDGDFKLIEFFNDQKIEVYNLKNDIGEQHNIAHLQPELTASLLSKLRQWRLEVGAQTMPLNKNYDPNKASW
ncbi:sulfatase [Psychrosphaera sp. B3R10]|uniref:sulfatase n=1 Tax=unclassified Psychrosphaera TaxID=2641570 RepID=UPI001C09F978|nr:MULTISPECIES: sulfatase [unclassified Psychrosphaera]MBU2881515.1 sulfatase [Psychrosphaera sp. I2R16]MBU2988700.1 sulfatase [Psychrosphaera sp. B3R10]